VDKKIAKNIPLFLLIIVGFFYRICGLGANHSFWTDENHVAIFARAILERGAPVLANGFHTGTYQWLLYWLGAISARIFGLNEFAIRFPSVIFGVLTIWAVWLLGRELFVNSVVSPSEESIRPPRRRDLALPPFEVFIPLVAATLITFLKIEILWSRQARPYQALQFFSLLGAFFIYKLTREEKFNWRYFSGFLGCGIFASLMHGLGLVLFFNGFLYLLLFCFPWFKRQVTVVREKSSVFFWIAISFLVFSFFVYSFRSSTFGAISNLGEIKNLFYYRVFLWHNYSLLVFLAVVGGLGLLARKKKEWQILVLFLAVQGIIVSFFLGQPFVRYFYIVFPFLVLLSAVGLVEISQRIIQTSKLRYLMLVFLAFFIVAMGNKFTLFPERIYSINEDMQEVPEVDYKKIYAFVGEKIKENPEIVYVANWNDHPIWYLGEGSLDYLLRTTSYSVEVDLVSGAQYLKTLNDFEKVVLSNPKGLVLLESWETELPIGAREYIKDNLKKEFEVDRLYSQQLRLWPIEIYSWGI